MKILKALYSLSFIGCLLQLMFWLFGPFLGIGIIYRMITGNGFHVDLPPDKIASLAERWRMSVQTFEIMSQIIAIVYFTSLLLVVISIFLLKKIDNRTIYIYVSCLFTLTAVILFA